MSTHPFVTISLVNWNGLSHTRECVRHCLELDYPNFEMVIVDNGSSDGSCEALSAELSGNPRITVLAAGRNLGFAGGNNLVLARALQRGSDFVWLLNNDTQVNPFTLRALVEAAQAHPRVGIFGSKILYWDRADTLWFAGGFIEKKGHRLGRHRGMDEIDRGQYDAEEEFDFITGCSLLIRAATVRDIHFMPERYFLYWEDVDWCTRARRAGWSCLYVPRSTLLHKVGTTAGRNPRLQRRYETRNRLLYHWQFNKRDALGAMAALAVETAQEAYHRNLGPVSASLAGACDFLLGRVGRLDP
jgi:GT2 family glycosyltransferase